MRAKNITVCSLFCALICIGAFIKIPIPNLPITMQTLFVLMAGMLLGRKNALRSVLIYILLGLAGLPIFTSGGGIAYALKPTFGYIIGFGIGAWLTGSICERRCDTVGFILGSAAGLLVIYFIGLIYSYIITKYVLNSPVPILVTLKICLLTTIPADIVTAAAAVFLCKRLRTIQWCVLY